MPDIGDMILRCAHSLFAAILSLFIFLLCLCAMLSCLYYEPDLSLLMLMREVIRRRRGCLFVYALMLILSIC